MRWHLWILWIGLLALTGCATRPEPIRPASDLHLSVFSLGYADSILLKTPHGKSILIDAGSAESAALLLAELDARRISKVDLLLLTHFHDNHYGALSALSNHIQIEALAIPFGASEPPDFTRIREHLMKRGTQVILTEKGNQINTDPELEIRILHPRGRVQDLNADSTVTWILFREVTMLFPADITPEVQRELLHDLKQLGAIDFVLLPHHGGELDPKFAKYIRKAIKTISTGPSKWISPDPKTLERFQNQLYRTDQQGTLDFKIDGERINRA